MPPRKHKTDHRHGGGGKHVSSIDEVRARNEGRETDYDRSRREREEARTGVAAPAGAEGSKPAKAEKEKEESGSEEEKPAEGEAKGKPKKGPNALIETANPNAVKINEDKQGVEMTRKKREELEKARARRAYEELHKQGKTDEAKADLGRLAEVKKRREEAALKKKEEEEAARLAEEEKKKPKNILAESLKEAMGTDESRKRGSRSSAKKDKDGEGGAEKPKKLNGVDESEVYKDFADGFGAAKPVKKETQAQKGTIEACREEEDDFM